MVGWLIGCLVGYRLNVYFIVITIIQLVGWLFGGLVGRLVGWLVGWLIFFDSLEYIIGVKHVYELRQASHNSSMTKWVRDDIVYCRGVACI